MTEQDYIRLARRELSQIQKTDRMIDRLIDTMSTLRSRLTYKGIRFDRIGGSGTQTEKDQIAEVLAKILDFEKEINARIDDVVSMKREAFERIARIEDLDQQNVLTARYIQLKRWDDISQEMDRSETTVYEIHRAGLIAYGRVTEKMGGVIRSAGA